jgi:ATP-dependent exoDNAse (exonuclease V) alpha subunit
VHAWERTALDHLRSGHIEEAVVDYHDHDRIALADNADALRQQLVVDWFASHQAGEDALMIATRRADVRDLNDRARALLDAAGCFGDHATGTDLRLRVAGREFAVGDQVLATGRNHYDLDILNGDVGVVTRIARRSVTFRCERDGEERTMPTDRLEQGFLDHGYARTGYKTQGATVDRAFILGDDGDLDRQAAYTALSRGRLGNRIYMLTPDDDLQALLEPNPAQPGREHVLGHATRELSRDRSQHLANELIDPLAAELADRIPDPDLDERARRTRDRLDALERRPSSRGDDFGIDLL